VQPSLGWRALAAARSAGARVVLHLHNYRLVCAVGTCFTRGEDCTRCHGRNTWPGVRLNCRGGSRAESAAYGAGIALWQRRIAGGAHAFAVPSAFALGRLESLGAPLGGRAHVVASVQREFVARSRAADGEYALYAGRLSEEKGVADAIAACRVAGMPLVVAGDGPQERALRAAAATHDRAAQPARTPPHDRAAQPAGTPSPDRAAQPAGTPPHDRAADATAAPPPVRFTGRVDRAELARLRAGAAVALVPSRYEEILPLAALEAMAAGLPVVASRAGGLAEVVPEPGLHPPGDVPAIADRIRALWRDAAAGDAALAVARERTAPPVVAAALRPIYDGP
jgi:glycosyltransferase involved in cell wall biosynthesis